MGFNFSFPHDIFFLLENLTASTLQTLSEFYCNLKWHSILIVFHFNNSLPRCRLFQIELSPTGSLLIIYIYYDNDYY